MGTAVGGCLKAAGAKTVGRLKAYQLTLEERVGRGSCVREARSGGRNAAEERQEEEVLVVEDGNWGHAPRHHQRHTAQRQADVELAVGGGGEQAAHGGVLQRTRDEDLRQRVGGEVYSTSMNI